MRTPGAESPAYQAYLALDRPSKNCPQFSLVINFRVVIHQGEVCCRLPGSGPQGLCALRSCKGRTGIASHFINTRTHLDQHSLVTTSDEEVIEFYKDLMKHEGYEGKSEAETREGSGRTPGSQGPIPDLVAQASRRIQNTVDVVQKERNEKRKRQQALDRAEELLDEEEMRQSEIRNKKTMVLEPESPEELRRRQRSSMGGHSLSTNSASETGEAEFLIKNERFYRHTAAPGPTTKKNRDWLKLPQNIIDLTHGEDTSDPELEPAVGPAQVNTARHDEPHTPVAAIPVPIVQDQGHIRTQITTNVAALASQQHRVSDARPATRRETDLRRLREELKIKNHMLRNQLQILGVEAELSNLEESRAAAE